MHKLVFVALLAVLTCLSSLAQEDPTVLSPSEAYKAALAPLKAARTQPNDLTDADQFALAIGVAQASRDCHTLTSKTSPVDADQKELIALGELCIFGQAFEPARATLVKYLSLPQPPEKKLAKNPRQATDTAITVSPKRIAHPGTFDAVAEML